jgi:hypothetical protein
MQYEANDPLLVRSNYSALVYRYLPGYPDAIFLLLDRPDGLVGLDSRNHCRRSCFSRCSYFPLAYWLVQGAFPMFYFELFGAMVLSMFVTGGAVMVSGFFLHD